MPTVVVENGTGLANANSYLSRADAETYFAGRIYPTGWSGATNDQKDASLIDATRTLDLVARTRFGGWLGLRVKTTQALGWPRTGVSHAEGDVDLSSAAIPTFLADATAELAGQMLQTDFAAQPESDVEFVKAGPVEVEYRDGGPGPVAVIPDLVMLMIRPYVVNGSAGFRVPMQRAVA